MKGWTQARDVLRGGDWLDDEALPPPSPLLSPNERRRSSAVTRLALYVAEEACAQSGLSPSDVPVVFASSKGDGAIVNAILTAVSTPGMDVSPTQFHNSVHNAAVGYWTIAHKATVAASALGLFDWTVGNGLLKAAAEAVVEKKPVLFAAYDCPNADRLGRQRQIGRSFGFAMVLDPADRADCPELSLNHKAVSDSLSECEDSPAGFLMQTNPAAVALPLLEVLAQEKPSTIRLPSQPGMLVVDVKP